MLRALFALAVLAASLASALAAPVERPEPGEVIDRVAHYTGLTNDAVSLALADNAAALGRLTDAVLAAQIAQRFLDARNAEIAADVFWSAADTAADKLLPPPLMVAIKAARVYKSMLEELRDSVVIPALDNRLYAEYRSQREQNADPIFAFDYATNLAFSGYYVVKPKMVEELIKARGWNAEVMGEKLRREAEADVDRFWRERMEATWQQELVKPQRQAILAAIWASVQDIIDQFKAPSDATASTPLSLHAGLFVDPGRDMPPGWWWLDKGYDNRPPTKQGSWRGMDSWLQRFATSRATNFRYFPKRNEWCRPGAKPDVCASNSLPMVSFTITIGLEAQRAAVAPEYIEQLIGKEGHERVGKHAAWLYDGRTVGKGALDFAVGPYLVGIEMNEWYDERAAQQLGVHFARLIIDRIQAESKGRAAAQ